MCFVCVCVQENGQSRLQQAQQDVEEVREIMLDNLNKASEREGKLGELENRADQLLEQVKKNFLNGSEYIIFL